MGIKATIQKTDIERALHMSKCLLSNEIANKLITGQEKFTENIIGTMIYDLYKNIHKCISVKHGVWVVFDNISNEWKESSNLTVSIIIRYIILGLKIIMSEYCNGYENRKNDIENQKENNLLLDKIKNLKRILRLLGQRQLQKRIADECKSIFYDPNIVIDLKNGYPRSSGLNSLIMEFETLKN